MNSRTIISLAAVCVLAMSAISASNASAGSTSFTCVSPGESGLTKFTDPHCKSVNPETGQFGHVRVIEKTTLSLFNLTNLTLAGKLFGATFELDATGLECEECTTENTEVGGVMEARAIGIRLKITGVSVIGFGTKCNVNGGTITTKPLKYTTTVSTEAVLEPEVGSTIAVLKITGVECPFAGENILITGKARATFSGATLKVNVAKSENTVFVEGEKASLKAEATMLAGKLNSGVHHPIALTSTTP